MFPPGPERSRPDAVRGLKCRIGRLSGDAGGLVLPLSLCYVVLRRVLHLAALRLRSDDFKELAIGVLSARTRHPPAPNPPSSSLSYVPDNDPRSDPRRHDS